MVVNCPKLVERETARMWHEWEDCPKLGDVVVLSEAGKYASVTITLECCKWEHNIMVIAIFEQFKYIWNPLCSYNTQYNNTSCSPC